MRSLPVRFVLSVLFIRLVLAACADWPQWRGPRRDGIVRDSPPLLEELPQAGLEPLWRSVRIPGGMKGGWSSPVVTRDRVYVYANEKSVTSSPKRKFTKRSLENLGWGLEIPPAVRAKLEAAAVSDERANLDPGDLHTWIVDWIAAHVGKEENDSFEAAYRRLLFGRGGVSGTILAKAAAIQDREFENAQALDNWLMDNVPNEGWRKWMRREAWKGAGRATDGIYCLDATTGKTVWNTEIPGQDARYACSATICVTAGRCYILLSDAYLYCFDASSGKVVWKTRTQAQPARCTASSVVVEDGVAVLLAGVLTGIEARTGKLMWTQPEIRGTFASPALWRSEGRMYLVCAGAEETFCVRPRTGEIVWRVRGGGWSTPAISGDDMVLYTNHKGTGILAYRLNLQGPERRWQLAADDRGASPVIHGGHVYTIGGRYKARARCIELASGKVVWEEKLPSTELASPVVVDGKLLVAVGRSHMYMIKADPAAYTLLGKARLPLAGCVDPAVVGGRMFLRLRDGIACYDLRK